MEAACTLTSTSPGSGTRDRHLSDLQILQPVLVLHKSHHGVETPTIVDEDLGAGVPSEDMPQGFAARSRRKLRSIRV